MATNELPNIQNYLARAAIECGFEREKFIESQIPSDFNKLAVILFFGDFRAISIYSSLLFKPFIANILKDKYVILCSYPGFSGLFPDANEYWAIKDFLAVGDLMRNAKGFSNNDKKINSFEIEFRRRFNSIYNDESIIPYYDNGLTSLFFDKFGKIERFFPAISYWQNSDISKQLMIRGNNNIFIYPSISGTCWSRGEEVVVNFNKDFWIKLTDRLLQEGLMPVVYQNQMTYDISPQFGEKCLYASDRNILGTLAIMRSAGCVLDLFSGISRLAIAARCPFIAVDERNRYINTKEYEMNDLCINNMYPFKYIFSFPTVIASGGFNELIDQIINVSRKFMESLKGFNLPAATELRDEVSYEVVKQHKAKKLGLHFIKVERLVIE